MPTYGYRCSSCGHEVEALQKMSDAPLVTCPECGQDTLRRQIYAAGVVFKGSGYYTTDYKGSKSGSTNGSKSPAPSPSESSSDGGSSSEGGKSEGKPDSPSSPSSSDQGPAGQ